MKLQERQDKPHVLRAADQIPGVLYGKGIEPISVQVDYQDLRKALLKYGTSMTFEVTLGNDTHLVYCKDYQEDFLHNYKAIHFDLVKVSMDDVISAEVHIDFLNRSEVGGAGQVLSCNLTELEVEYKVGSGINHIDVDCLALKEVDAIYVKDVTVPEGVTILNDPEQVVCNLTMVAQEKEETEEVDEETIYDTGGESVEEDEE
jgi:large subunit ribosomal protein L25